MTHVLEALVIGSYLVGELGMVDCSGYVET